MHTCSTCERRSMLLCEKRVFVARNMVGLSRKKHQSKHRTVRGPCRLAAHSALDLRNLLLCSLAPGVKYSNISRRKSLDSSADDAPCANRHPDRDTCASSSSLTHMFEWMARSSVEKITSVRILFPVDEFTVVWFAFWALRKTPVC